LTNTTTTAVVVLISYGKNGNGAITVKGSQNVRPVAGTNDDELMNVNVSGTGTQYVKRDYTDSQVAPYGAFDDLVRVVQATDLISPLTKDGSLQSSTGSAIQTISAISSAIVDETIKTYIPGTPYYLPSSIPLSVPSSLDPWGHSIVYTPDPKLLGPVASGPCADANSGISFCTATPTIAYTLRSWGPDGATGGASTADDIVVSVPLTQIKNVLNKIGY
jgi:hypothetical protein